MYQHINHATMVTILEEARIPFLREPFEAVIEEIGLLIHEVKILYKGQLRLRDSPLQVTMFSKRVRAVDFTIGYEVRSVRKDADSRPAVIAETQLRSEEHTSESSHPSISYAVFCLKKKITQNRPTTH